MKARTPARTALITLFTLFAAAALAPFVGNELPLVAKREGGWAFPAFAALETADFLWLAGLCAAAAFALRKAWRAGALAAAALLILWGAAFHSQRIELGTTPASFEVHAPLRFGPSSIDYAAHYAGVGSPGHPLGTDELGRDVLVRLLYGLRLSLSVGFAATLLATAIGIALGAWAGWGGRVSDALASWIIQLSFCLPAVFVVAAAQSFGAVPLWGIILVLALLRFGPVARLTRQECVRIRTQGFVLAARGLGLHPARVFARHVLPNALIPATVAAAFGVASAIMAEAGLSFLGLGVPEPVASLGRMLYDGRRAESRGPHLVFLPGLVILIVILACHTIGAALRDAVDPRGAEATS
jgi:peptide/nickel transport system permease protein